MGYVIVIWIVGMFVSYFVYKSWWKKQDEWTVGSRMFCIFLCILMSWVVALSVYFAALQDNAAKMDKKAKW